MPFLEPRAGLVFGAGVDPGAWERFTAYLPGYAHERERIRRLADAPLSEQLRDFGVSTLVWGGQAIRARGPFSRAMELESIPQAIPTIMGGRPSAPFGSADIATGSFGMRNPAANNPPFGPLEAANANVRARPQLVEPAADAPVPVTQENVTGLLQSLGMEIRQVKKSKDGTVYIKFDDPNRPRLTTGEGAVTAVPSVRIPADGHAGRPPTVGEVGVLFDAASAPGARTRLDPRTTQNESGQPYSDFRVLEAAMRSRFGPPRETPAATPGTGEWTPRQLPLLEAGSVAGMFAAFSQMQSANDNPWDVQDVSAGRFAEPRLAGDPMLLASQSLRRQMEQSRLELDDEFGPDLEHVQLPRHRITYGGIDGLEPFYNDGSEPQRMVAD
jgi:hypothetical protein